MHFRWKKISVAVLLLVFVATSGLALFRARPAYAQFVVSEPIVAANTTINNVEEWLDKALLGGVTMAFINALNYFTQKIAYDSAVWIASGGKGEGPLFHYKNVGDYLGDVALGAAGEAIGTISEVGFLGFNLCEPAGPDGPQLRLALALGLANQYEPPTPRCEWSRIASSWDEFVGSFETGEVLERVSLAIGPGQTGIHAVFQAPLRIDEQIAIERENAARDREEQEGFRSVTDVVTGRQRTPAAVVRETALEEFSTRAARNEKTTNASIIGPVLARGVTQVLSVGLGTFVNTLGSQLLKRAIGDGFLVTGDEVAQCGLQALLTGECSNNGLSDAQRVGVGGRAAAQAAFADLLAPRLQEINNYDAVTEFTVCPNRLRSPNNCVMDTGFAAAVRVALQGEPLTIKEALRQGYLNGQWPLIGASGEDQAKNSDPFCFTDAYCYSNLVKLRRARIIPIGFEMAAAEARNADGRSATLQEVVDGFNRCPGDGDDPNAEQFRWCRLIDPDWVLKYPVTQCRAKVYGPTLVSDETDIRAEICVDTPSCISEGPNQNCTGGFGYCTAEKTIWRSGADTCPAQFASCQTYRSATGVSLTALTNTVDKSICSQENAGCRSYATLQDPANGEGDWLWNEGRLFLDRQAGICKAEAAGCSELVAKNGVVMNLVRNASFENDADGLAGAPNGRPDQWRGTVADYASDAGGDLSRAVSPAGGGITQTIFVDPGVTYTLSFYGRRAAGGAGDVRAEMQLLDGDERPVAIRDTETTCGIELGRPVVAFSPGSDTAFESRQCSFTVPVAVDRLTLTLEATGGALIDAVQLQEGRSATAFSALAYDTDARSYLKVPPRWMGCTGETSDPAACDAYATICRADEVGCDAFAPVSGGTSIPGIVSEENRCPAECAGYATYRQEANRFDVAAYPVHLIPSRADQCSAAAAGCTEFTNLEAATSGGEAREYWSDLRACEKPGADPVPVYYTWEGSDTAGFQLKEWRLKAGDPSTGESGRPPAVINPADDLALCTADVFTSGANPDCREFFDAQGNVTYRLYTRTIVVSAECRALRATELPVDESITDAGACSAAGGRFNSAASQCGFCTQFGGTWNNAADATDLGCTFFGLPSESRACAPKEAGCRLYAGNAGRNVRTIFTADYEDSTAGRWTGEVGVSTESTVVGGHSLRVDAGGSVAHPVAEVMSELVPDPVRIVSGGTYFLSFWGKGRGTITARFSGAPDTATFANGGITLGATWQRYVLGPVQVTWAVGDTEQLLLSGFSDVSFIDNIELSEIASNIALVKESWDIPAVCDQNSAGALLPQAQLGCTQYRSKLGNRTEYLTGFSSLCREKAVGCSAFRATQQSDSSGRETWNAVCVLGTAATSQTPCSIDGTEVCTVSVNRRSCRYKTDDLPAPVSFTATAEGACQVDGVLVVNPATGVPNTVRAGGTCTGYAQDMRVVPADASVYLVQSSAASCGQEFAGCTLAGQPSGLESCRMPDGADADTDPDVCRPSAGRNTCTCARSGVIGGGGILGGAGGGPAISVPVCEVAAGETACRAPLPWKEPYPAGVALTYTDTAVMNNPRTYEEGLCTVEAVGCEAWSEKGTNAAAYFKQPDGRECEYRENVEVSGATVSGWFKKGLNEPCDSDNLVAGVRYNISLNGDANYQGYVGMCPTTFSGCTEFDDPFAKSPEQPRGAPYYLIKNAKLDDRSCNGQVNVSKGCVLFNDTSNPTTSWHTKGSYEVDSRFLGTPVAPVSGICVNEQEVCSERGVPPFVVRECRTNRFEEGGCNSDNDCDTANGYRCDTGSADANVVLKVTRDRMCAEWLACQSSSPVWDPALQRFREVCDSVGLCNEAVATNDGTECVSWVTRPPRILSKDNYRERTLGYAGMDYSGYSIPQMYPVESLKQIAVGRYCVQNPNKSCTSDTDCANDPEVRRVLAVSDGEAALAARCGETQYRLARVIGRCTGADGTACPGDRPEYGAGKCWSGQCAQSPYGTLGLGGLVAGVPQPLEPSGVAGNSEPLSCRAYPERNSPFPNSVVTSWSAERSTLTTRAVPTALANGFRAAAVCENGQLCECNYLRAEYKGGQNKVFLAPESDAPLGICQGGDRDLQPCDPGIPQAEMPCGEGGLCQKVNKVNAFQGLSGYCLERDLSTPINGLESDTLFERARACATWFPVDRPSGTPDIYNSYTSAGFNVGNAYLCALPEAYQRVASFGLTGRQKYDIHIKGKKYTFTRGNMIPPPFLTFGTLSTFGRTNPDNGAADEFTLSVPLATTRGQGSIQHDCPASVGFALTSRSPESGRIVYMCVPWNSRHMADPEKRRCDPPPVGRGYFERPDDRSVAFWRTEPTVPASEIYILEGERSIARNIGMVRPDGADTTLSGPGVGTTDQDTFRESVMAYYGDCQAVDVPLPGPTVVAKQDFTPYLGCELAVQVASSYGTGGSKPFTGRIGNGRSLPAGAPFAINQPQAASLRYTWQSQPAAFGIAQTSNILRFSQMNRDFRPLEIPTCKVGETWTLPVADGEGGLRCPEGNLLTDVNTESRPYMSIVVGDRTPKGCTPGGGLGPGVSGGDEFCSGANGQDLCERTAGNNNCFFRCTPGDAGDLSCSSRGLGSCSGSTGGVSHCSSPSTDASLNSEAACEADETRVYVGRCRAYASGRACVASRDCVSFRCVANPDPAGMPGYCEGTGAFGTAVSCAGGDSNHCRGYLPYDANGGAGAAEQIVQLFAKTIRSFLYLPANLRSNQPGGYVQTASPEGLARAGELTGSSNPDASIWSSGGSDASDDLGRPPVVLAVGDCSAEGKCLEGAAGQVLLNGQVGGDISGDAFRRVTLKFFGYAQNDQMPIRQVTVDWGDGVRTGENPGSSFKNRRGYILDATTNQYVSRCSNSTFGTSPDACDDSAPFNYTHVYSCNVNALRTCSGPADVNCATQIAGRDACVFKPRVQIKDNWGFCNGTCPGGGAGASCYDATTNPGLVGEANECNLDRYPSHTPFSGRVIVYPR